MVGGDAEALAVPIASGLVAVALLGYAFVARWVAARVLALAAVGALVATSGLIGRATPPLSPEWAGTLTLLIATASGGSALAVVALALVRAVRQTPEGRRTPFPAASATEARNERLVGLLRREHKKLQLVREMHRYFELATRNSQITVLFQDRDLRYEWVVNPRQNLIPDDLIGRTDEDVLPASIKSLVLGHKRRALATGMTQTFEVEFPGPEERAWFRMDVVPISVGRAPPTGLVSTAIDISRSKRLDTMRTDLSRRLAETLQRFNLALRSERIMVFSQDTALRYTWANSDETQVGSIIGRTDEEVLPAADRAPIMELKLSVMENKRPQSAEVGVGEGSERRWYDLHVEPNLRADGSVSGVTCASIDITHRKRNEEQMRLVMRELTHRTKNLLTVVIAIARQTSQQATTVDAYVPALIARLRALSVAQDLIVADEWAGVDLGDLVRLLVGQFMPAHSSRVLIAGPPLVLSPEASQNIGLAVHELAANAVQYGAFANAVGTLEVSWAVERRGEMELLVLTWTERGGPAVSEPTRSGFGMTVIERNLSRALNAEVKMAFSNTGLVATITLPLRGVLPFASPDRVRLAEAS